MSPAADRIVLVPHRHDPPEEPGQLVLYELPTDTLTLLPPLEAGWFPRGVTFSGDSKRLAAVALREPPYLDRVNRSRIILYDFLTGQWQTVVDSPVFRESPKFVSDDRELLYYIYEQDRLALLNLADGRETVLSFLPEDTHRVYGAFGDIFDAQFRTPNEILFLGRKPRTARLKAQVEKLDKGSRSLLYRVPVEQRDGRVRISGLVELLPAINAIPEKNIYSFWYLPQTRDLVFKSSVSMGKGRLEEAIYVVRDGQVVASTQTPLMMSAGVAPSADGKTIAFLGNPSRLVGDRTQPGLGKDLTELFFYDVAADAIRTVPLVERVNELLRENEK